MSIGSVAFTIVSVASGPLQWTVGGTAINAVDAVTGVNDSGKYIEANTVGFIQEYTVSLSGVIPSNATITYVTCGASGYATNVGSQTYWQATMNGYGVGTAGTGNFPSSFGPGSTQTTNPATGLAWTVSEASSVTIGVRVYTAGSNPTFDRARITHITPGGVVYTVPDPVTWKVTTPLGVLYKPSIGQPTTFTLPFDVFAGGILYPAGSTYTWVLATVEPTDTGYWLSIDETFAGASYITNNSRPKDPRGFTEVVGFATSDTGHLGGFPGPSCVWNNHFVYAQGLYTPSTNPPVIRIFDGEFDRPVTSLPNTSGGVVPVAVMSMLTANGQIYLSTYDTGTSSSDFIGRVFSLDVTSGQLTPIGAPFPTGHIPYTLAWHGGRLWCGTNRQSSTASGKIFYFRPGIDTTWTDDYTLSTSSMAGCSSLLSYGGKLYVGTTAASGTFAKVLVRSELGVYTTSKTASGGSATANNGFPALVEFNTNLYASYWNNDGTPVSLIYKFDGSTWSTVYTGSGATNIPFIGFPTDNSTLLAIGGGTGYSAVLLSTTDGSSWSDRSAFLPQGSPASTGIPVFGVVMH